MISGHFERLLKRLRLPSHQWITDRDRRHFDAEGYMVIRNVIPRRLARNAVREIAGFIGADLSNSASWYRSPPQLDGVVPLHHAQSLWDIRQNPSLYHVFTEFFGNRHLMADINRCIFRPPVHRDFPSRSYGTIHWDADPRAPGPASLQAVVLLTGFGREEGGFQCLPEVYKNLDAWLQQYAMRDDFDYFHPRLKDLRTTQVEGRAGDVILWSTRLPHGSAVNLSTRPRVATFVTMQPPNESPGFRESMKTWWLTKRAPDQWRGLPGQIDPEPGEPARLSQLGRKLIGVSSW